MKKQKDKVQDLVNIWNATSCRDCSAEPRTVYNTPHFLDEDGTLCSLSGKPGKLSHAADVYSWYCGKEKYKHRRPIGEVEALAYIKVFGNETRDEELERWVRTLDTKTSV